MMAADIPVTLVDALAALGAGTFSSVELTAACIERAQAAQPRLNVFISLEADAALAAARASDEARARAGRSAPALGPLHGVPLAHKDMYYRAGKVATCGSRIRRDWVAPVTSTALARLDAAGSINLGTLNLAEFAFSPTGHNVHFGDCCNPWNPAYITGGSSSGSAAGVAAGLFYGALGSDTGGSIRVPAALCGVSGIKPTWGRVSRAGAMPLSQSLDHVGPLARSIADCAWLLQAIAGADPADPTASVRPVPDLVGALGLPIAGLRIGLPDGYFDRDLAAPIAAALEAAAAVFEGLGARVVRVPMPALEPVNAAGTVLMWAEAASAHQAWLAERPQDYGAQVRSRLEHGAALGALQYQQALKQRGPALDDFCSRVFDRCDLLLAPTHAQPVPTRGETDLVDRPEAAAVLGALTRLTRPFNYLGLPTASLPAGFDSRGMPIGLQLVGAPWSEALLCTAGDAFQRETDWHLRRP
ncbi:MAG: amidase [Rhodocyclaceae bacterium]|nr:amidase [Rhodocyclaceae bacterium]MCA4904381.1 amidase [Rhodocyclaceae bacterium]